METLSETEFAPSLKEASFIPNAFVDITGTLRQKVSIMNIYKSESGAGLFPRNSRNIAALAKFRGASAGCRYAEAFMILKELL